MIKPRVAAWPRRALAYAWAAPCTLIGLLAAGLARLVTPLRWRLIGGVIEVVPAAASPWAGRAWAGFAAITLGHLVLGCSAAELERLRVHEHAHVAQYERWGALFLLAYPLAGAWCWLRGGSAHADNPFERQACAAPCPAQRRPTTPPAWPAPPPAP